MHEKMILEGYIEKVWDEIMRLAKQELDSPQLFWEREKELHVLFENCKHAELCIEEIEAERK